jgi:ribosomal protein L15
MPLELDQLLRDEALIDKVAKVIAKATVTNALEVGVDDYGFHPEARAAIEAVVVHIMGLMLVSQR